MGSVRAESEINKMIMLQSIIMTEEQRLPTMEESKAMYRLGLKRFTLLKMSFGV
jgi:hypothetical protein